MIRRHRCPACGGHTRRRQRVTLNGHVDARCARCADVGHWPRAHVGAYCQPTTAAEAAR